MVIMVNRKLLTMEVHIGVTSIVSGDLIKGKKRSAAKIGKSSTDFLIGTIQHDGACILEKGTKAQTPAVLITNLITNPIS